MIPKGKQGFQGSSLCPFVPWFLPRSKGRKDTLCTSWNIWDNVIPSTYIQLKSESQSSTHDLLVLLCTRPLYHYTKAIIHLKRNTAYHWYSSFMVSLSPALSGSQGQAMFVVQSVADYRTAVQKTANGPTITPILSASRSIYPAHHRDRASRKFSHVSG